MIPKLKKMEYGIIKGIISSYMTIRHFKITIKIIKQNAFNGINADKLTLWKVNIVQTKK